MKEIFILEVKARLATTVTPNQLELIDRILREELVSLPVLNFLKMPAKNFRF